MTDRIVAGCMRFGDFSVQQMNSFIHTAAECGVNSFDHADIYAGGRSEEIFGEAFSTDGTLRREDFYIQSKCGIRNGFYDLSEEHILGSVDKILSRLRTGYLDALLLHRPDALMEPEEIASAFDKLSSSGKVRRFGVSNFNPLQIELLKKYVKQPLEFNQLQFGICTATMVSQGMEVNMDTKGSVLHDASVLDYCRMNGVRIQAWSPFQKPGWKGPFINDSEYGELNRVLSETAASKNSTPTQVAAAWVLKHPANMQLIAGTTNIGRLKEIAGAAEICMTREEWYSIYRSAGNIIP